ncbi:hypothetical protein ACROYT_G036262 [Oculina patagonica]
MKAFAVFVLLMLVLMPMALSEQMNDEMENFEVGHPDVMDDSYTREIAKFNDGEEETAKRPCVIPCPLVIWCCFKW